MQDTLCLSVKNYILTVFKNVYKKRGYKMPESVSFCVHEEVSSSGPVLKANLTEALVCSGYAPGLRALLLGDVSNNLCPGFLLVK